MLTNQVYSAPETEVFEVRFEEGFLDSVNGLQNGNAVRFGAPGRGASSYDDFDEE